MKERKDDDIKLIRMQVPENFDMEYNQKLNRSRTMKIENIGKARELMEDRADLRRVRKSVVEQPSMNINGYSVSSKYLEDAKKEAIKYLDKKIKQVENQLKEL